MLTNDKGFTVVELLISIVIVGFVLTGIYSLAISSSRFYLGQNAIVVMQADGRAAMDFMAREIRSAFLNPIVSTTIAPNDTISFDRIEETGYSSGNNADTMLNDLRKSWNPGIYDPSTDSAYMVRIIAGTGVGQTRTITQNTTTRLTISPGWGIIPDDNSFYIITMNKGFTRTSTTDNILKYRIGTAGSNNQLSENIINHSFTILPNSNIQISLTARTPVIDPTTQQFREYKLTEEVRRRN
jgi:prepilin-type N-terminal cleavage/methylation domain-containing protein